MQQIKKVVIAGGGTAGWLAAAALSKQLGPLVEISLVESDAIGTVGVGEATIPTILSFHQLLGISEAEFIRATQATFKLGIAFESWGDLGDRYIHSFGQVGKATWMGEFHHFWLHAKELGFGGELGDYCYELQAAEQGKFATSEKSSINYAYHLDATRYAGFLRRQSEARGVRRVEGKITTVQQHPESGFITALTLDSGWQVEGDLFIDCTGFSGILIEQTLGVGYEDWTHWLPTNSALAVQTESSAPAKPYTRAIAHEAGWRWQIPLQHRVGNGMVFCDHYQNAEQARAKLLKSIEGRPLTEPRLIRYKTGRRHKVWEKNCIALGLSSGFLEPLESTSIHLIMIGLTRLMQMFPFAGISEPVLHRFNEQSQEEMEKIRDFIILHYKATQREDTPFWKFCREMEVPDSLAQRIALFEESALVHRNADELFRVDSWVQVMLGQRIEPRAYHHMGRLMGKEQLRQALFNLKNSISTAIEKLPRHQDFIDRYSKADAP